MKRFLCLTLTLLLALSLFAGCSSQQPGAKLCGRNISEYTIVYSDSQPDYTLRAAQYIQEQIRARTGVEIPVCEAASGTYGHEIVVGETNRAISSRLSANTDSVEFSILADENHIALEGDYFIIAAAAYYFVETYIPGKSFETAVPREITVHSPITEAPKNFIFLIGDGMGPNHTKLMEEYSIENYTDDSDREHTFYGNYLPYEGTVRTGSLTGVTDSAAASTALACGYKTNNSYVGMDKDGNALQSLTELAAAKGMATAVMSTDQMNGATPSGFTAHTLDRDNTGEITSFIQEKMKSGTIIRCGLDSTRRYQDTVSETLAELENEAGFFLMYEEGFIDKHAHKNKLDDTIACVGRFNQVIGIFMEYAFYHPDTFLIITADHETGGLTADENGRLAFTTEEHTGADVPIYGYGQGAEVFADCNIENTEIPKVIAKLWGVESFGDQG